MTSTSALTAVLVGAGPTAVGVLDRLLAHAGGRPLEVHLVDPHPAGGGRIWRTAQSDLLWANSLARDITVLPDASSTVAGPVGPGTTLSEWAQRTGVPLDRDAFPPRTVVNAYLSWVLESLAAAPGLTLHRHIDRVVDVEEHPGGVQVRLAGGDRLDADVVVLAQGHLDREPGAGEQALGAAARAAGLTHVPTGYTADLDLDVLQPGEDVLVRGAGLAFVDLVTLLTGGRGGRFDEVDGRLVYRPSGREPVLHVGSRRGVPYRAKLGYPWAGPPVPLTYLTPDALRERFGDRPLDLRADLAPVVARELGRVAAAELFRAHPERTRMPWAEFAARYDAVEDAAELWAEAVPDPADRFDLAALDRPLAGRRFADGEALQEWVRDHVRADLARAADPAFSQDQAVFTALLFTHGTIAGLVRAGRLTERSEREDVSGWWMNLFSYLASGPPSPRLRELLALSEAGVVRFTGADTVVTLEAGRWVARSASTDEVVTATALVEARVPEVDLAATTDPLLTALLGRGLAAEKGGRLHVDAGSRLVDAGGRASERVSAVGFWTSGAQVAAFARPGTDAPFFHQNDALAARLWRSAPVGAARAA
ncbi:FAD/NAD(P)-binding protein [Klenkia brasiliensis]|uniref:FAD-NAD(P)-binding n=1 Tax=Klenkia brasiliensis TaxID=333142 RepID=A0A1G7PF56_9ACTN|nr:FAD/NAD(P)-binding protein [Klenkia brasiliensis]SDF84885.1 FAD-NAD(P)-binding [Klenkia brasiliensis]